MGMKSIELFKLICNIENFFDAFSETTEYRVIQSEIPSCDNQITLIKFK